MIQNEHKSAHMYNKLSEVDFEWINSWKVILRVFRFIHSNFLGYTVTDTKTCYIIFIRWYNVSEHTVLGKIWLTIEGKLAIYATSALLSHF